MLSLQSAVAVMGNARLADSAINSNGLVKGFALLLAPHSGCFGCF